MKRIKLFDHFTYGDENSGAFSEASIKVFKLPEHQSFLDYCEEIAPNESLAGDLVDENFWEHYLRQHDIVVIETEHRDPEARKVVHYPGIIVALVDHRTSDEHSLGKVVQAQYSGNVSCRPEWAQWLIDGGWSSVGSQPRAKFK